MSTDFEADQAKQGTSDGATTSRVRAALWVVLAGSVLFWVGLPFPVVADFFEAEGSPERIALVDENRGQFALSFGLLGLGAAVAGIGLWMLGRSVAPIEARRSRRRKVAAQSAAWLGLLGLLGGLSRLLHAVLATPAFIEDGVVDPIIGVFAGLGTSIALIIFGTLAWAAPPPKWTAVVLVLGGVAATVTFLPLFWYTALIVFAMANLIVMRRRRSTPVDPAGVATSNAPRGDRGQGLGRTRSRVALLVALPLLAGSLSACGDDDDDAADTAATDAPAETSAETEPAPTDAPVETTVETEPTPTDPPVQTPVETDPPVETSPPAETTVETEPPSTELPADAAEFCAAYTSMTAAFGGAGDPSTVPTLLDTIDAARPEDIEEPVGVMVDAARTVVDSGFQDFSATESPEFGNALGVVDPWVFDNCDLGTRLEVSAVEYAFEGAPAELDAGPMGLLLTNNGIEAHEIALVRKADGTTETWEELFALPEAEADAKTEYFGAGIAGSNGDQALVLTDLTPGEYIFVCFLPVGSVVDDEGQYVAGQGEPHAFQGMLQEFSVS